MIWLLFGIMLLAAAYVVARPIYAANKRWTPGLAAVVIVVLAVPAAVYTTIGTPVPPEQLASLEEMADALGQHLKENPQDVEAWKRLGQAYAQLEDFRQAAAAFDRVVALESPPSAQSLAELGEALLMTDGSDATGRPAELFESALALEPANPTALFYGGIVAIERGNTSLAADRWEALLALGPPPEIQDILRQGIAAWRGESAPPTAAAAEVPAGAAQRVLDVEVSLSPGADAAVARDATVFIIARDPDRPSPPIAATRRTVADLPARVSLSDADAMLPGRPLSSFEQVEIVARVSLSGQPAAQAGDWYGERTISASDGGAVEVVISEQLQ